MADDDGGSDERPSFAAFWKKGKDKLRTKKSVAALWQAQPHSQQESAAAAATVATEAGNDTKDTPQTERDKALHRRLQVRRAQIQHRQRKANYVKQLELDVSRLRDLISLTESEARALDRHNEDMRAVLRRVGVDVESRRRAEARGREPEPRAARPEPLQLDALVPVPVSPLLETSPEMFADIDVDELTVTLSMDETMGTPCFHVSASGSSPSQSTVADTDNGGEVPLTPAQEQRAINFILALEHVCWDHYALGDFHTHSHQSEEPRGHALMASAYCMASAPETVYTERAALAGPNGHKHRLAFGLGRHQPSSPPTALQWQSTGMTLESLHGLARSLNPGDKEVTPVQAWFELAARYPLDALLRQGHEHVLDALLREFRGVVRCVAFGAAIERLAFESVVVRVLGHPVACAWQQP